MKSHVVWGLLVLIACAGCMRSPETKSLESAPTADLPAQNNEAARRAKVVDLYGKLPLTFVQNRGQLDERVRFQARSPRATVFFTPTEVVFHFVERDKEPNGNEGAPRQVLARAEDGLAGEVGSRAEEKPRKALALRVSFVGANPNPVIEGREELPGKVNVFKGNDPDKWLTNIPTYREVVYRDLWPGIDLVYRGEEGCGLKYDLVVHPGGDPRSIRLRYEGHERLSVSSEGELIIHTALGPVTEKAPCIYQDVDGRRVEVEGSFKIIGADMVSYRLGAYDPSRPLVIDPGLVYSTFLGGSGSDYGYGIAVDASGNAYVTGYTYSSGFPPTPGAYDTSSNGDRDTFVTKLNAAGSGLVYSTFLGGYAADTGIGIAVDASGNAYVTGDTWWSYYGDFPTTPGAYDRSFNGSYGDSDAFVTKLNGAGNGLVYSTFLGGSSDEYGKGIAVDASGNAYVTGLTHSWTSPGRPGHTTPGTAAAATTTRSSRSSMRPVAASSTRPSSAGAAMSMATASPLTPRATPT